MWQYKYMVALHTRPSHAMLACHHSAEQLTSGIVGMVCENKANCTTACMRYEVYKAGGMHVAHGTTYSLDPISGGVTPTECSKVLQLTY
jgi:hypothetical protein